MKPSAVAGSKRLRTSVACDQCKASKKRCLRGRPCSNCLRRRIACTFTSGTGDGLIEAPRLADARPGVGHDLGPVARALIGSGSGTGSGCSYSLDLPPPLQAPMIPLLDWYFEAIAPIWPVVERADVCGRKPFAAPLLTRAVCLVAALTNPDVAVAGTETEIESGTRTGTGAGTGTGDTPARGPSLVADIVESVQQCFEAHDLGSLPSLSTLQALLLLLCCPVLANRQAPVMVTAVCAMAISLGLHRPHAPRPVLYWSCIAWARWDALRQYVVSGRAEPPPPCFDMDSARPLAPPPPSTCFGAIYALLEAAEQKMLSEHAGPDTADPASRADPRQQQHHHPQGWQTPLDPSYVEGSTASFLVHLTRLYLTAPDGVDRRAELESIYPHHLAEKALAIYPFSYMIENI